ncbi:SGNH/GDSL hydrolase family protein [Tautonia sociabilis]|uniref:SGNH/GDSL hydrolase family protein n=1 Tax=Tautonia sociabilis TaxID=2080755 RepID=A0A432MND2_9BACT|nr:SGNH/GDSL hydrolase family protein [Tautonia sociabilis]RUL88697.1 SGNH/GDSL hydrolase family protein [Tautonia sociabilis]
MRLRLAALLLAALSPAALAQNPAFAPIEDDPALPRVLLLGDSISIGYTIDVREALDGVANVHRPAENCGPTTRGLERLDAWLGDGDWDVIHANFGLHDLKFVDDQGKNTSPESGHRQVPLDEYQENLARILSRLKETGATVIFATTTPVPHGEPQRKAGDERAYNAAALRVADRLGVEVNDLHAFIAPKFESVAIRPGNVHFSGEGSKLLGNRVAEVIEEALRDRR